MSEVKCSTTHHAGCACHEARRDAERDALRRDLAGMTQVNAENLATVQTLRAQLADAVAALEFYATASVNAYAGDVEYVRDEFATLMKPGKTARYCLARMRGEKG